jgi:HEPN domain-containing protein
MRKSESKKFIEKAKGFYEDAKNDFEKKRFDIAAFHLEQVAQLLIKAKLLEIFGDFPKIHDVKELLTLLSKKFKKQAIENFLKKNMVELSLLSDAYITARYYFREFSEEEIKRLFDVVKKIASLIEYEELF